jgi:20S proteasome subunit beta 1
VTEALWSLCLPDILSLSLSCGSLEHNDHPSVHTAANVFKKLCYNNKDNLMAGIIVAGWDKRDGGSVYNIPLGGSLHKQPYAIGGMTRMSSLCALARHTWVGSGSTYIYGFCDSAFKENMSKGECEKFVIEGTPLISALERPLRSRLFFLSLVARHGA